MQTFEIAFPINVQPLVEAPCGSLGTLVGTFRGFPGNLCGNLYKVPWEPVWEPLEGSLGTFRWHLRSSVDSSGNRIEYKYVRIGSHVYLSSASLENSFEKFGVQLSPGPAGVTSALAKDAHGTSNFQY